MTVVVSTTTTATAVVRRGLPVFMTSRSSSVVLPLLLLLRWRRRRNGAFLTLRRLVPFHPLRGLLRRGSDRLWRRRTLCVNRPASSTREAGLRIVRLSGLRRPNGFCAPRRSSELRLVAAKLRTLASLRRRRCRGLRWRLRDRRTLVPRTRVRTVVVWVRGCRRSCVRRAHTREPAVLSVGWRAIAVSWRLHGRHLWRLCLRCLRSPRDRARPIANAILVGPLWLPEVL